MTIDLGYSGAEYFELVTEGYTKLAVTGWASFDGIFTSPTKQINFGSAYASTHYTLELNGPTTIGLGASGHFKVTLTGRDVLPFVGDGQLGYFGNVVGSGSAQVVDGAPITLTPPTFPIHGGWDSAGTITYAVSYMPETSTWATMLAGFAALGLAMRRRARVGFA